MTEPPDPGDEPPPVTYLAFGPPPDPDSGGDPVADRPAGRVEGDGRTREPSADDGEAPRIDPRIRARRIEVRRRAGRRRLRRLVAGGAVVGALVLALLVSRSPLLDVDRVRVVGAERSGVEAIVAASGVHRGDRLTGVPLGRVAARVRRSPWVAAVQVGRDWPGTVTITVVERVPVAAVAAAGGGFVLVDEGGIEAGTLPDRPAELVLLEGEPVPVVLGSPLPDTFARVLPVAASIPPAAGGRVLTLRPAGAASATTVGEAGREVEATVRLPDGSTATVLLGAPDQLGRKWLALLTVLDTVDLARATTIDVRVPNAPTVRRR